MSAGSNSFGQLFRWTSFGESHGPAMGVVIDGCPAGLEFNEALLLEKLYRRRPGQAGTTNRNETDRPEVLSGVFAGKTLGTPIAVIVKNENQKSSDYEKLKASPRVGHADDVWEDKFGHRDHRGGGRASARETVNWVIAGAVAEMFCRSQMSSVEVEATLESVGGESFNSTNDPELQTKLDEAKKSGESFGALINLCIRKPSEGLGEPIFHKFKSEMAKALMIINACAGVELGEGFAMAQKRGTEVHTQHDSFRYGGIRGGISTGEEIRFRLAFKPTASIKDVAKQGRHDPCVALRALPIAEAMAWNVMAEFLLAKRLNQANKI